MKRVSVIASLAASSFLLSSFTAQSPADGMASEDFNSIGGQSLSPGFFVVQGHLRGEEFDPTCPDCVHEELLEATIKELACLIHLLEQCNESNVSSHIREIDSSIQQVERYLIVGAKIEKEYPETREGDFLNQTKRLNAAFNRLLQDILYIRSKNFFGSPALEREISRLSNLQAIVQQAL